MKGWMHIILFCCCGAINAQTPADWWYFGDYAGVHFGETGPVADTNGQLPISASCAGISNACGDLLFYTDGKTIFNSQHDTMMYGAGLMGLPSAGCRALILPQPGNDHRYYVFTLSYNEVITHGVRYTVVDMNLNGGLGAVDTTLKNVLVRQDYWQSMGALRHGNGEDYWFVVGDINVAHSPDSVFFAYRLSSNGLDSLPMVSPLSFSLGYSLLGSQLRFGIKGDKAAFMLDAAHVGLIRFDRSTGLFVDPIILDISAYNIVLYGFEFSPNDSLMYVSRPLLQMDVSVWDSASIAQSVSLIASGPNMGGLQLGPDRKIYQSINQKPYLARIEYPDSAGLACTYVDSAVFLEDRNCSFNLPYFFLGWFDTPKIETNSAHCFGDSMLFSMDFSGAFDSILWDFDNIASGANYSKQRSVHHVFSDTGLYHVSLTIFNCTSDTVIQRVIRIYPEPVLDLGEDQRVCTDSILIFDVGQPYANYLWHNGSDSSHLVTSGDSVVSVTVFGVCGTLSDTVSIDYDRVIELSFVSDTVICDSFAMSLQPSPGFRATYVWNTGDTVPGITVGTSGIYSLTATNACGVFTDTSVVTVVEKLPEALLPGDSVYCLESSVMIRLPDILETVFLWSDSSSGDYYTADSGERIWLHASNACGEVVDTMEVGFEEMPNVDLGPDTLICVGETLLLNAAWPQSSYMWSTGDTTAAIEISAAGVYTVTIASLGCRAEFARIIDPAPEDCDPCRPMVPNVFTPNDDGVNDVFIVDLICPLESFQMVIFNRWGQEMYHTQNMEQSWDGTHQGDLASEGVYYVHITAQTASGDKRRYDGSFSLLK